MFRRLLKGASVALIAFHVWLFARQAWAGELARPGALVKWLGAALLIAALVALSRQGASLVRGRRAVAIWLLAALLHAPAIGERLDALDLPAIPEAAVAVSNTLAAAALIAVAFLLLWLARAGVAHAGARRLSQIVIVPAGSVAALALQPFSPRPPPAS